MPIIRLLKTSALTLCSMAIMLPSFAQAQEATDAPLLVAAGSLRNVMNEIAQAYETQGGAKFTAEYGPSGELRKAIEGGKRIDVFASADIKHTDALAKAGLLGESKVFAHNDLCVIAQPRIELTEANVVDKLLDPAVRVATSTPVSDPMGDYTWQFFRNADGVKPGAYATLDQKALKLSGATAPKPGEKLPYVTAFEDDKADAYVMYCTNAVTTKKSVPNLEIVRIPDALNVRSVYGIAAQADSKEGQGFMQFVLGAEGQAILRKHGFN